MHGGRLHPEQEGEEAQQPHVHPGQGGLHLGVVVLANPDGDMKEAQRSTGYLSSVTFRIGFKILSTVPAGD